MKQITIAIGTDHRGFAYKEQLKLLDESGDYAINWQDKGCFSAERTDYPPFGQAVAQALLNHEAHFGVLLCGSGIGMAIAANRYPSIYAGVAWNSTVAQKAREDDHVNILVIPADYITQEQLISIFEAWLLASPKPGRYADRLAMIDAMAE